MTQVSERIASCLEDASWIRRMFEEGARLRLRAGAERVCDFSLGNPHLEPPADLIERLANLTARPIPGMHRYMPNAGYPEVRQKVADRIAVREGRAVPADHVVMTGGAASGLNVVLRTLLDPGDKVVLFTPLFPDYRFYVMHAGGECQLVPTTERFDLDPAALDDAIDERTRAVLLNSPNNPTGRVYPKALIAELVRVLRDHNRDRPRPIVLITDDPYRRIVYDGIELPRLFDHYEHTVSIASFSKDLGLAGERIGYLVVHPDFPDAGPLLAGMIFCLRSLGFVNAPALMQRLVADVMDASVDVDAYRRNRDALFDGLTRIGYEVIKPEGAFFLFPRAPISDDVDFVARLQRESVLSVPGRGFACPGHFRLSYAVEPDVISKALPRFEKAFRDSP